MASFSTLIVDIETVGQDKEAIPERALNILLGSEDEEAKREIIDRFGLDPVRDALFVSVCIGSRSTVRVRIARAMNANCLRISGPTWLKFARHGL